MPKYTETEQVLHPFFPPFWEEEGLRGLLPGRFRLPLIEQAAAILRAARNKNVPDGLSAFPPGWAALFEMLRRKGLLLRGPVYEPWFTDSPKLYSAAFVADVRWVETDGHVSMHGGFARGTSESYEEAISKGIGELLERYPLARYRKKDFIRASARTLQASGVHFLDPGQVASFTKEQQGDFPEFAHEPTSVFSWVKGRELTRNVAAHIPAQLVFWNYCRHRNSQEPALRQPNTNGAAGGFSRESAILGGIRELLQRDAFFIHWLTKTAPRKTVLDELEHPKLSALIEDVRAYRIEPHFLYLTVDHGMPIYVCVLVTDEDGARPKVNLGGGCASTHEEAMYDALREAISVHRWIRLDALKEGPFAFHDKAYAPFREASMKKQEQRLRWWARPESFGYFSWFLGGEKVPLSRLKELQPDLPQRGPKRDLEEAVDFFRKKGKGYEVYVYDTADPIARSLGFHSVKVIVPELVPLYLDETYAPLAARRLAMLAPGMPEPSARTYGDFFPWPHPFP